MNDNPTGTISDAGYMDVLNIGAMAVGSPSSRTLIALLSAAAGRAAMTG